MVKASGASKALEKMESKPIYVMEGVEVRVV